MQFIQIFSSIRDATFKMSGSYKSKFAVSEAIRDPEQKSAYGFRWYPLVKEVHYKIGDDKFIYDQKKINSDLALLKPKKLHSNGQKAVLGRCVDSLGNTVCEKIYASIKEASEAHMLSHATLLDNINDRICFSKSKKDNTKWTFSLWECIEH